MTGPASSVPADDRALHYGDGVFETIRFCAGHAPLWSSHLQRLAAGCERLRLPMPDPTMLWRTASESVGHLDDAVVKLIVSAGGGQRGYARPTPTVPRVYAYAQALDLAPSSIAKVRWCETRLSIQPLLAGIKHLNRLEQVLARSESSEPGLDEGLMLNTDNQVIAATAGNLCLRIGGRWLTPRVDRCGIAGVARRWIMDRFGVAESVIDPSTIDSADALVICNALRGPRQVMALGSRTWEASHEVDEWRRQWDAQFATRSDARETCR